MRTLSEIAQILTISRSIHKISQKTIMENTGLTSPTIRGLMSATKDSKLTTLMAVADELGLELMLVPKGAANTLANSDDTDKVEKC